MTVTRNDLFAAFQATRREMSLDRYAETFGEDEAPRHEFRAMRAISIVAYAGGSFFYRLDDEQYRMVIRHASAADFTFPGADLPEMERKLWGDLIGDAAIIAEMHYEALAADERFGKASQEDLDRFAKEACDLAKSETGITVTTVQDEDENYFFLSPMTVPESVLHGIGAGLMRLRPDLKEMSLDEWIVEHRDRLSSIEYDRAKMIVEAFYQIEDRRVGLVFADLPQIWTFTYEPADDDCVDPQWALDQDDRYGIQDATAYGGGYVVTEASGEGANFGIRHYQPHKTLDQAKQQAIALAEKAAPRPAPEVMIHEH